jgi:IPT/TIG domain
MKHCFRKSALRGLTWRTGGILFLFARLALAAQPEIVGISPITGSEGTRVAISGKNLQYASSVMFGIIPAVFNSVSPGKLIVIAPHKVTTSIVTVITPEGRICSRAEFIVLNDPRIPDEVSYKAGYVNPVPRPAGFGSARLWGIAIADSRVPGNESAQVEVAWTRLTCRVDGREVVLNDDGGQVQGGLYRRQPWFGTDAHGPMPLDFDPMAHAVVLRVGMRPDRVWHFWSPSPRATLPPGRLEGCTARARVKISPGALLQMGMDYWRSPTVPYGAGGNNHEAGASDWYFPSPQWQEVLFSDVGGPQF